MKPEDQEAPEPPDSRINWTVYTLVLAAFCLLGGMLAPLRVLPWLSGKAWFGVAVLAGAVVALLVNVSRPRYETGRWRSFYDFLLRQMPPPD